MTDPINEKDLEEAAIAVFKAWKEASSRNIGRNTHEAEAFASLSAATINYFSMRVMEKKFKEISDSSSNIALGGVVVGCVLTSIFSLLISYCLFKFKAESVQVAPPTSQACYAPQYPPEEGQPAKTKPPSRFK